MKYQEVIDDLERRIMMPKTMPGLDKMKQALSARQMDNWGQTQIITVAGTNGKGTTCIVLESLLLSQNKKVGLYTSPHLVSTTERIRYNGQNISEIEFVSLFEKNQNIFDEFELSHFECLTMMAAEYFIQKKCDFVIFEVGLGGTYDATNVFSNQYSVITQLGLDHQNILGNSLRQIAQNKFGIIKQNNTVVHHAYASELSLLVEDVQKKTASKWVLAKKGQSFFENQEWFIRTPWGIGKISLPGQRAVENAMTALTLFEQMGFSSEKGLAVLENIYWPARMQKIMMTGFQCPVYLSGDHNIQGVESLIKILQSMTFKNLHLIIGIGKDKNAEQMLDLLFELPHAKVYLTETPFKGLPIESYTQRHLDQAVFANSSVEACLFKIQQDHAKEDLVVVTGSLYLAGLVLGKIATNKKT